jgi:hypothetical protein
MDDKRLFEGKRELRWTQSGSALITFIQEDVAIADELWDRWIAVFSKPGIERLFVCAWGAIQPTHQQWRRANKAMRDRGYAVTCVTENRHTMALIKAASWVGTKAQAFAWNQLHDACEYAGVSKDERVEIKAKVVALRDAFGRVASDVTIGRVNQPRVSIFGDLSYSSEEIQQRLDELQVQLRKLKTKPTAPAGQ